MQLFTLSRNILPRSEKTNSYNNRLGIYLQFLSQIWSLHSEVGNQRYRFITEKEGTVNSNTLLRFIVRRTRDLIDRSVCEPSQNYTTNRIVEQKGSTKRRRRRQVPTGEEFVAVLAMFHARSSFPSRSFAPNFELAFTWKRRFNKTRGNGNCRG